MTPEFSRPERLDSIGAGERAVAVAADPAERAALARRFDLRSIERLEASVTVRRDGGAVLVAGRVTGAVTQACSVTGDPLPAAIDEPLRLRFVDDDEAAEEVELTEDSADTLPIEGGAVDLGEAVAQTLLLALDPFPRGPNAEAALAKAGVLSEGEAGPFAKLAGLRKKLTQ